MSLAARISKVLARPVAGPAVASDADERRWAKRKARNLPAWLSSDRLQASVPCVILDMSSTGAKLEIGAGRQSPVASADGLPDSLALVIASDEIQVACKVAWRNGAQLGVRFSGISQPRPRPRVVVKRRK